MTVDDLRIKEKLNKSKDYLALLETIISSSKEEFSNDFENQIKAERCFEVLSQIMLDICTYIIATNKIATPTSYSNCMLKLGQSGILNLKKSEEYSKLIKMRILIVHQYDKIDYFLLFESLKTLISDFNDFQEEILLWVEKQNH